MALFFGYLIHCIQSENVKQNKKKILNNFWVDKEKQKVAFTIMISERLSLKLLRLFFLHVHGFDEKLSGAFSDIILKNI